MFGRKKPSEPPPPSREDLERKTDSLRPGADPEALDPNDVTGVIDLATERLRVAQEAATAALEDATRKLHREAERACRLARSMRPEKG